MRPRSLCAIALLLALPALGQTEPQIEPLVPPNAPWLQKNQKKRAAKKAKKPPAEEAQKPAEPGLSLPPLEPLTLPPPAGTVGVLVQGSLPEGTASRVGQGLEAVARRAPGVKDAFTLQAPQPCADEACWVTAGIAREANRVVVAGWNDGALRLRLVDVKLRKQVSEAQHAGVAAEPLQVAAWAEALACKLLVVSSCTGVAVVEAPSDVALEIDGRPLRSGEKKALPVGVHTLRVRDASGESSRPLAVLIEGAPPLQVAPRPPPVAALSPAAAPEAAVTAVPPPSQRRWTKTAGYAAAGAAVLAVGIGAYFGVKSKSEIDSAESAYRANGNAWTSADLDALHSGNSKAQAANVLFIASGVLLAAGAALTFAF